MDERTVRWVMCWKCASGIVITDKHSVACVADPECVVVMRDFTSPPDGCPIKKKWEEDDERNSK